MAGTSRRTWLRSLVYGSPLAAAAHGFGLEPRLLQARRLILGEPATARFAFFTDLHFKGSTALLDAVLVGIRDAQPDFVLFGGDLVEEAGHLGEALERLSRLGVPLFGVPGNHDYWSAIDFAAVNRAFEATGGAWLLDRAVDLAGGRLRLSGHTCTGGIVLEAEAGRKNIALMHYPAWADRLPAGYDLILAGHTHGGQVRLPWIGALVTPPGTGRYPLGWYHTHAGPLYVSSGVGTYYLNVRFLCPPEWVLVEI